MRYNWAVLLWMRTFGLLIHPSKLSLAPGAPVTGRSAPCDSLCKPLAPSPQGLGLGCMCLWWQWWEGGGNEFLTSETLSLLCPRKSKSPSLKWVGHQTEED